MEITPLVPVQEFVPWNTLNGVGEGGGTALGATIDQPWPASAFHRQLRRRQFPVSAIPKLN